MNGEVEMDGGAPKQPEPRTVIDEFNEFFGESAGACIRGDELLITVGNRTMHIQLPGMVGGESKGLSN